ncbi:MAG TPA: hypothetical protein V6D33_18355 [Cyanophyceae cyanobacterium]
MSKEGSGEWGVGSREPIIHARFLIPIGARCTKTLTLLKIFPILYSPLPIAYSRLAFRLSAQCRSLTLTAKPTPSPKSKRGWLLA